jgi:tetratricopeptide (TPR) repeat protein
MRYLALVAFFACLGAGGCGGPTRRALRRPDAPAPMIPARDLAGVRRTAPGPDRQRDAGLTEKDPRVVDLDIIRITAHTRGPGGEPELTSVASAYLFKHANEAAKAGRPRDATATYRQLVAEFPGSQFAPVALFDIAALYDAQGDLAATLAALAELVAKYPGTRESIDGHLYIAALEADHAQWAEAAATLAAVLARTDLTFADRIEAFARKGYVEIARGQLDAAEDSLSAAVDEWRAAPRIDDPYYIAMAHYYRGELMHRRFAVAQVRHGDDEMVADLAAKRALAAKAYDRWREALRFHQAHWATAAGYQMSQIFVELWEAHIKAPYPRRIEVGSRPTYVADVHVRVRKDLEKALEGHRMNVELARAFGIATPWSEGSERQAAAIMELLAKDVAGRYAVPAN